MARKFWPVVMWFSDIEGDRYFYVPSWSHMTRPASVTHHLIKAYASREEALDAAMKILSSRLSRSFPPAFYPSYIESNRRPNYKDKRSYLVQFAINDGSTAAQRGGLTQETD